jgi:hypothetical protein|tara:strand:- start:314 stop:499 length:186 start_codon:yes stop_codon:yes gene_type:complete
MEVIMNNTEKEFSKLSTYITKQIEAEKKGKGRCTFKLYQDVQIDAFEFVLRKMDKMKRSRA